MHAALGGLPVDVVVHPLVDLVRVLAKISGKLLDGGGVGVAKKALVPPLTKAHRGQSNRDRTFDHESKKALSAGRASSSSYENWSDRRLPGMNRLIAPSLAKRFSSDPDFLNCSYLYTQRKNVATTTTIASKRMKNPIIDMFFFIRSSSFFFMKTFP